MTFPAIDAIPISFWNLML
jgi:hypothetical protein